jgi:DNA-binding transcriptional ArsR family regulator
MATQKHVRVLEEAELVATSKIGRSRYVHLRTDGLRHAVDWLKNAEARWNAALDRLGEVLEEEKQK